MDKMAQKIVKHVKDMVAEANKEVEKVGEVKKFDFSPKSHFEIGKKYNIKPGAPNHAERIEGGLLSYGNDMLISDNPFECGFEKIVHLNDNVEFIGKDSLKKILKNGIKRKLMGVKINSDTLNLTSVDLFNKKKQIIGNLRSAAFSPTFKKIVGIAMINRDYCKDSQNFKININNKEVSGSVCNLPMN